MYIKHRWQSTLKTVVMPFWKKMMPGPTQGQLCGPEEFGQAGWGWRAGPGSLGAVRQRNSTFPSFTFVYFSQSVEQEHLRSIGYVYSLAEYAKKIFFNILQCVSTIARCLRSHQASTMDYLKNEKSRYYLKKRKVKNETPWSACI